jgi:hypothetical protein
MKALDALHQDELEVLLFHNDNFQTSCRLPHSTRITSLGAGSTPRFVVFLQMAICSGAPNQIHKECSHLAAEKCTDWVPGTSSPHAVAAGGGGHASVGCGGCSDGGGWAEVGTALGALLEVME